MKKRCFLVFGLPNAGKTYLATELEQNHSFGRLSLDNVYVQFIKEHAGLLYFDALDKYIAPHYEHILKHRDYSIDKFGRDFVQEWQEYLIGGVLSFLTHHDSTVVEGCVLEDSRYAARAAIDRQFQIGAFLIQVVQRRYVVVPSLRVLTTVADVATLTEESSESA